MEFKNLKVVMQKRFKEMCKDAPQLFEVAIEKNVLWDKYMEAFAPEHNKIYRKRSEHDCNCCRSFINNIGNVVAIKNGEVISIWDFEARGEIYQPSINAMSAFVHSQAISDVFVTNLNKFGIDKNFELKDGKITEYTHFFLELERRFVQGDKDSIGTIRGSFRDIRNVFKRSLEELTEDSVKTVLELINQGSLYKGGEWKSILSSFLLHKLAYMKLTPPQKELYTWEKSLVVGAVLGKIRNHSIGVLLTNISDNMELDEAVRKYEAIVAPSNYKRPKAIFTKAMLESAKKELEKEGLMDSLGRRYATLDDITVNNILFANKDSGKRIIGTAFDKLSDKVGIDPKKYSNVEEVTMEKFVKDILPTAITIEALFENRFSQSMVSLIAPMNRDAKSMFKWNNGFSWAYAGNVTDSMKERVKAAGGKVDGVLRFSIQWNDEEYDENDLDAHCLEPRGTEISFRKKRNDRTSGMLDVDIIHPNEGSIAVENITWSDRSKMQEGTYKFFVNNFSHRGGKNGFSAEIEFDGELHQFRYNRNVQSKENVYVAEVTFSRATGFTIKPLLSSTISSKNVWGVNSNQFVPVSTIMYSPNYWDEQDKIGHKHFFFMLKDCVNTESPNGFFNEYLDESLMKHKRVFEALGSEMSVAPTNDQLSGIGFSSTKRNTVTVKVKGAVERVLKITI